MANQPSSLAQFAQNGMRPIGQQNQNQNKDQNEWQRILSMLLASQKMDWGTMAGFGLGKLLRDYAVNQKAKVDARGQTKGELFTSTDPKEIQDILETARKNDMPFYQRLMKEGAEKGLPWANIPASDTTSTPQPDLSGINPDARALPRARTGIFGDPATLFAQSNNAPPEGSLVAGAPFTPSSFDIEELQKKYNLFNAINGMGWQR